MPVFLINSLLPLLLIGYFYLPVESTQKPGRILVAYAPDTKSHLSSMMPMLKQIALSGHQVHIFEISSEVKPANYGQNITAIRIPFDPRERAKAEVEVGNMVWKMTFHSPMNAFVFHIFCKNYGPLLWNHTETFANVLNSHWDLFILDELFSPHAYGIVQLLNRHGNVPYIVYSSTMMMGASAYENAMGHSWITHPLAFMPPPAHPKDGYEPAKFWHRLVNFLEAIGEFATRPIIDRLILGPSVAKLTGKQDFSFAQLYASSEMSMVDTFYRLGLPMPEAKEVLNAGVHCDEPKELPEEYRKFIEDPTSKGTVYIAFGTIIQWDYAPPNVLAAFFEAFERLPEYRFIFAFKGKLPKRKLPAHLRLVSWAPQQEILAHPKTKVFLTHCGLKSIKESICSRTPMLAMPIFAEQNHNARMMVALKTGIALNKYAFNTDQLHNGLTELLQNPMYAERIEKLQQIFLDRPIDALDEGEFYVSKIIEKGESRRGRHFFRRKGAELTSLEHFFIDWTICILFLFIFIAKA